MRHLLLLVLTPFVAMISALGQTSSSDSQTLRALLEEVRQLRHDLQVSTAMTQRAQIALYRLQRQDEAVSRATQRLSDARSDLANVTSRKTGLAAHIEQAEATWKNNQSPEALSHFEEIELPALKSDLDRLEKEERLAQAREAEAEQQLRDEQGKLDSLNDTLDRLNTALEETSRK